MAWMETNFSKDAHFGWKIKWRLEHLGALGTMGEMVPQGETLRCSKIIGARVRVGRRVFLYFFHIFPCFW